MSRLLKIDELVISDHFFLTPDHECYYFMEYTARAGYGYSNENQLIFNLKKSLEHKGSASWRYKLDAINKISRLVSAALPSVTDIKNTTLVPMPPSKIKSNPLFDDRMKQILELASNDENDIRELIVLNSDMEAVHIGTTTRSISTLMKNAHLDITKCVKLKPTIILFDDVITTGAHFVAYRNLILQNYPDKNIIGIFIARRSFTPE
jgi:predicted amidophosphoribosyltransferase